MTSARSSASIGTGENSAPSWDVSQFAIIGVEPIQRTIRLRRQVQESRRESGANSRKTRRSAKPVAEIDTGFTKTGSGL